MIDKTDERNASFKQTVLIKLLVLVLAFVGCFGIVQVLTAPAQAANIGVVNICPSCGGTMTASTSGCKTIWRCNSCMAMTVDTSHSYAAATCTAPKTCTKCGATTGSALGHSYYYENTSASTCMKKCSNCSYSAAGSHSMSSWSVTTSATCTRTGSQTRSCSNCGREETETIATIDHVYDSTSTGSIYLASAATCTSPAEYYYSCLWCTATSRDTFEYGEPLGHSYAAATCTKPKTCTRCSATSGSSLGHDYEYEPLNDSACYGTCTRCGAGSTLGHNWGEEVTYEATCTTEKRIVKDCQRCGYESVTKIGGPLGHSYYYVDNGSTHLMKCSTCGGSWEKDHNYTATVVTKVTCTTNGQLKYTCDNCKHSYTETVTATGHEWEASDSSSCELTCANCGAYREEHNYVQSEIISPTCTEGGYIKSVCTNCGNILTTGNGGPLGHDYRYEYVNDDTCHTYCARSGCTLSVHGGHDWEDVTVNATCTKPKTTYSTCSQCKYEKESQDWSYPPLNHSYSYTDNGENHITKCTRAGCGGYWVENHILDYELGVDFPDNAVMGTYWHRQVCINCGHTYEKEAHTPQPHCTNTVTCTVCKQDLDPIGHVYSANCDWYCDICGETRSPNPTATHNPDGSYLKCQDCGEIMGINVPGNSTLSAAWTFKPSLSMYNYQAIPDYSGAGWGFHYGYVEDSRYTVIGGGKGIMLIIGWDMGINPSQYSYCRDGLYVGVGDYSYDQYSGGWESGQPSVTFGLEGKSVSRAFYLWFRNNTEPYYVNYNVLHYYMDEYGVYRSAELVPKTAQGDTYVWAPTQDREGYATPEKQQVAVSVNGDTYVEYKYPIQYTVIYHANGGSGSMGSTTHVCGQTKALAKNTFTRTGYTFKGWANSQANADEGKVAFTDGQSVMNISAYKPGAEVNLYAVWEGIGYNVTWDAGTNGGTIFGQPTYTNTQSYGDNVVLPSEDPVKSGPYVFAGWFTAPTGGTQITADTVFKATGPVTYYAQFKTGGNYNITWDAGTNGGTINGAATYKTSQAYGTNIVLPSYTPVKPGHSFIGWYTAPTGGTQITAATVFTELKNVTYYAQFKAIEYEITWDAGTNGGTINGANSITTKQLYGTNIVLPSNPSKAGHTFRGWYTAPTGGTKVTTETTVTGSVTYYAQFDVISYNITWDAGTNGGTINGAATYKTSQAYGSKIVFPSYTPVKTGYTFIGWYTAASGGTQVTTQKTVTGTVTYYARFEVNTYEITWDAGTNGGTINGAKFITSEQTYGAGITLPSATPVKTGCTFIGWYTAPTGGTQIVSGEPYITDSDVTYYAQFKSNGYDITWDAGTNGGTINGAKTITSGQAYGAKVVLPSATPVKTGYTFTGWFTAPTGGTQITSDTVYSVVGGTTYYAQFKVNSYTITWDAGTNGGTVNGAKAITSTQIYGAKVTLPSATPVKTGYTFTGWFTAASGGTQITADTTYSVAGNVTYYAQFKANSYTVTWDAGTNGGTVNGAKTITTSQTYGAKVTLPPYTPVKAGYTFTGWFTAASGGTQITADTTYTTAGNVTYYAQFKVNSYTITWDAGTNGGTINGAKTITSGQAYGAKVVLPSATPVKTGYTFTGWFTAASGGTQITADTVYKSAGNITYYAQFKANSYTVTWDAGTNGGTINGAKTTTSSQTYDAKVTLPSATPVKAGYTFTGWYTAPSGGTQITAATVYKTAGNITYYAQFKANSYTVTWDAGTNGGTINGGKTATSSQTYDAKVTLPSATPVKAGYTFTGWYTAPSGGTQITANTVYKTAGNITYYAQFKANSYTVTWDAGTNGGTINGAKTITSSQTYGAKVTLPSYTPTKTGYTFTGWFTAASGGTQITADTVYKTAGNVTYYAQFKVNSYSITWDAGTNGGTINGAKTITTSQTYGAKVTLPSATPVKAGYTFTGWFTAASGGTQITANTVYSTAGGVTYYAHFEPNSYTITWNAGTNGGTINGATTYKTTQVYDSKVALPSYTPVKKGYSFTGWFTAASGGTQVTADTVYKSAGNVTYYAHFEPNSYTITWNAGYNSGTINGATTYKTTQVYDSMVTLPQYTPTRDGYTFAGWFTAPTGGTQITTSTKYTTDSNVTYYAQFKPNAYDITWDAGTNGGTIDGAKTYTSKQTFDANVVLPSATPVKTGYTFVGWFTSASGGVQVTKDTQYTTAGKRIYYAQFKANSYNISYDLAGGTAGTNKPDSATYDAGFLVSNPTRKGYVFAGWKITGMDTVTHYYGSSSTSYQTTTAQSLSGVTATWFKNLQSGNGTTVTFTATWQVLDVELSGITLKYKDSNGVMQTVTNLNDVPLVNTLYVFHTYKNNSGMEVSVDGYHQGTKAVTVSLAVGESKTVQVGTITPALGSNTVSGSVYLSGSKTTTAELNESNNAKTLTYRVMFDLELSEVYLADANGTRLDTNRIMTGVEVYVHYVYKNLYEGTVSVDAYLNGTRKGSVVTMAPGETRDVIATSFTPINTGSFTMTGAIYRSGMTATTEKAETNLSNNTKSLSYTVIPNPSLDIVEMDGTMRVGADVFTSFTLVNDSNIDYTPGNSLTVTLTVYDASGRVVESQRTEAIVPANEEQLVWFRWTVPNSTGTYKIRAEVEDGNYSVSVERYDGTVKVVAATQMQSPDTVYEDSPPPTWYQPSVPSAKKDSAKWTVWEYENGAFKEVTYGISVSAGSASITPNSKTAYLQYGIWHMKSGYGVTMDGAAPVFSALSGCEMPSSWDYTDAQWVYAVFPEFSYSYSYATSLELVGGTWQFIPYPQYTEYKDGRLHFTPIWYPDSTALDTYYHVKMVQTDIWTPVGVLTVSRPSNGIIIEGDMYDDWYTG